MIRALSFALIVLRVLIVALAGGLLLMVALGLSGRTTWWQGTVLPGLLLLLECFVLYDLGSQARLRAVWRRLANSVLPRKPSTERLHALVAGEILPDALRSVGEHHSPGAHEFASYPGGSSVDELLLATLRQLSLLIEDEKGAASEAERDAAAMLRAIPRDIMMSLLKNPRDLPAFWGKEY